MRKAFVCFMCMMAAMALALSCSGMQNSRMGTLALSLQCDKVFARVRAVPNGNQKPASIEPEEDWSPARFTISGTGPGAAGLSLDGSAMAVEERLPPGEWAIEVKAFSAAGKEVAAGSSQCLLQPGRTTSAKIILYPIDGSGNLLLNITTSLALPPGGRVTGNLSFKGLPGKNAPQPSATIPIDIPAEQATLGFEGLGAGHYGLTLKLLGSDGVVSGGCAETVLIVAGFQTKGTCAFELGMPAIDLSASLYPSSPLPAPILSAGHSFAEDVMPLPIAISRYAPLAGETMRRLWYQNGDEAGTAIELVGNRGLLPAGSFVLPRLPVSSPLSTVRIDFVEESLQSFRAGSSSATLDTGRSTGISGFRWRASYDFKAAMGRSLGETTGSFTNGTGSASSIKAIASSPSGLVAVLGLDDTSALHAFAAAYGAELDPIASPGATALSIDASWVRLWRNKLYVDKDYKNADRIAVSNDGRFIAAANTVSSWIWLGKLDEGGLFLDAFETMPGSSTPAEMTGMGSIRALCFSADGRKLYAVAKANKRVYAFDVDDGGLGYSSICELNQEPSTSTLQDVKATRSGSIVISAETTSRLYVIQNDSSFSTPSEIIGNSESGPYHPTSIALSEEGDAFYVLCDGNDILCFSRSDPSSPYTMESSFSLPYEAQNANAIAVGKSPADGSCETLAAAGGNSLVFLDMGPDRMPITQSVIPSSSCTQAGIAGAKTLSYIRGAFIMGNSGNSGIVSVFGRD